MSNPDLQYFASSGTWVKPPGAGRVDVVLQGVVGKFGGAHLGTLINPNGYGGFDGEPGEIRASFFDAAGLPDAVEVEVGKSSWPGVGKGSWPGGRAGYALIVTHLDDSPVLHAPGPFYTRAGGDGTGPRDPICVSCGRPMSRHGAEQEAER